MPRLIPLNDTDPPRFDLYPHEEVCDYEDGRVAPIFPGMGVGDLLRIDGYLTVYRIVGEDERGHRYEVAYRLPEPEFVR